MPIQFFSEDIDYKLQDAQRTTSWLIKIAEQFATKITNLNFIFCSDAYLLTINKQYLNHDYYTDIITFDHAESPEKGSKEIFSSALSE